MYTPSTEEGFVIPHSFISTHSSLDTNGFSNWYKPINKDIVCSGQTPFDTYYGEENNTAHVSFTQASKDWLFKELKGNKQNPTIITPNNLSLDGDLTVCLNKANNFTLSIPNSCSGYNITWSTSNNIEIISSTNNTITVIPKFGHTEPIGHINAYIQEKNINLNKVVWVGIPSPDFFHITKVGSYQFYANQWTKLKIIHPIPPAELMNNDNTYGLTYHWSVPNSQIKKNSDTSTIDVNPFNSGQLNIGVKLENQCGCSNYKYQLFNIQRPPGTNPNPFGGGILTPIKIN